MEEVKSIQKVLKERGKPKYRIEGWISLLSMAHRCIGINLEGKEHPDCKTMLMALVADIQEVITSL